MNDRPPGRPDNAAAGTPTSLPSERGRRGYPGYPGYPGGYPGQTQEVALDDLWRVLRRQGWVIVLAFSIVVGITIYLTSRQTPVWQASSLIRIEGEERSNDVSMLFTQQFGGGSELETEMRVVSTRPILSLVVDSLDLNLQINMPPEGPRHELFSEISLNRTSEGKTYSLSRLSRDLYGVETVAPPDSGVSARFLRAGDEVKAGERVTIPGGFFTIAPESYMRAQDLDPPTDLVISTLEFVDAVTDLQGNIVVLRPDSEASLFEISLTGTDPVLVADMVNEVATAFLEQRRIIQNTEATSTVVFLNDQSDLYLADLQILEEELQEFRESEQVVALASDADEKVRRLAALQAERAQVAGEKDALEGLLVDIAGSGVTPDYIRLVAFPTFLQTEAVTGIVRTLVEVRQKRTAARERWTERHPGIVALDEQATELEERLGDVGRNYYESLNGQLESLDDALELFREELEALPGRELRFARLQREVELTGTLHSLLQTRLKEAEIAEAVEDPSVRVVEPAIYPRIPIRPRPRQNLALGAFLGLVLGVGIAFARERMDQAIRSNENIDQLLGIPVLTRVPHMVTDKRGRASQLITADGESKKQGYGGSVSAEAYRILRTNVLFAPSGSAGTDGAISGRELIVTSAGAQEGKSVTSSNLAVTFAQQGHRTLIVDADLRRSTLHRIFETPRKPGLADYLMGGFEISDVVQETEIENLFLLPAGVTPTNPTELLGSQMMNQLLEHTREFYDCFVIDTPPVLSMADAAVLGGKLDGVVLVVRADRTHRKAAQDAIAQLTRVGAEVLGIVLNDSAPAGRYGYRYSYYYDYYAKDVADTSKWNWKRPFSSA